MNWPNKRPLQFVWFFPTSGIITAPGIVLFTWYITLILYQTQFVCISEVMASISRWYLWNVQHTSTSVHQGNAGAHDHFVSCKQSQPSTTTPVNDNTRRPPSGSHVDAFWASVMMALGGQKRGEERRNIQDRQSLPRCVQGQRDISAESLFVMHTSESRLTSLAGLTSAVLTNSDSHVPPKPNNPPHPV